MPCGDGGPRPGSTAHLPAVPMVDAAAVLHAVQHQVPPQGLHGVAIPLTGMGEGGRRVNQVRQREIADAWEQEVAVAEGRVRALPGFTLLPRGRAGCGLPPRLSESALLQVGTRPDAGKVEIPPSLLCKSKICLEKRLQRSLFYLQSLAISSRPALPCFHSVQKCPDYHLFYLIQSSFVSATSCLCGTSWKH